jgi:hypothetical protein
MLLNSDFECSSDADVELLEAVGEDVNVSVSVHDILSFVISPISQHHRLILNEVKDPCISLLFLALVRLLKIEKENHSKRKQQTKYRGPSLRSG